MKTFLKMQWSVIAISRLPERIIFYSVFFCPFNWINQNIFLNMFQLFYYNIKKCETSVFDLFNQKVLEVWILLFLQLMRHVVQQKDVDLALFLTKFLLGWDSEAWQVHLCPVQAEELSGSYFDRLNCRKHK